MFIPRMIYTLRKQDEPPAGPPADTEAPADPTPVKFSQDDMDRVIKDRLARERKSWEKEQADAADKAKMTEVELLKAAKAESDTKATELQSKVNQQLVRAEAKVQALAAGANPARVTALLKLADFSGVTVGDDGEPDAASLKAIMEAALNEYSEFRSGGSSKSAGTDFSAGNDGKLLTHDSIMAMSPAEMAKNMPAIEAFFKKGK